MVRILRHLQNERGNMTIFTLTIYWFIFMLVFVALFNFSTVFVDKEQASNSAQQASIAAVKDIYDEMDTAIKVYDASPNRYYDQNYLSLKLEAAKSKMRASHPDWSQSEIEFGAIDSVLSNELPGSVELQTYVSLGLKNAASQIPGVVRKVLSDNKATLSGSSVKLFNSDNRIEVTTSVKYESESMGFDFIPAYSEQIYQTGESRRIGFIDEVSGWVNLHIPM
ncbi:Tad domain-containing protein [Brevibacillus sp. HB1.3]|uniref:Tad domain-containing protein n=1 Tax=Brevibacillus sp. HB1.3 TaxID=2738842 RepID=UPI0015548F3C|nr:Tad domain-containing protein [Brevibacillus sp. HB1.3]NQF15864.1 Tad domain-containing protein [Brevibacillus sp. HB1.3]